jgi:hypothetical protein
VRIVLPFVALLVNSGTLPSTVSALVIYRSGVRIVFFKVRATDRS